MGICISSASERVKATLANSPAFDSACDSAYNHCLSLTQHAFEGVMPYQLPTAADHIHVATLQLRHPLILKWLPLPPTRTQIDSALRRVTARRPNAEEELMILDQALFKEWAAVLFAEAVVGSAEKAILTRVPLGVAGIVGVGAVTRSGKELVGAAMGVYALGVAASIYLSLSG